MLLVKRPDGTLPLAISCPCFLGQGSVVFGSLMLSVPDGLGEQPQNKVVCGRSHVEIGPTA